MQHIMSCSTPETAMATMRNAAEHAAASVQLIAIDAVHSE